MVSNCIVSVGMKVPYNETASVEMDSLTHVTLKLSEKAATPRSITKVAD